MFLFWSKRIINVILPSMSSLSVVTNPHKTNNHLSCRARAVQREQKSQVLSLISTPSLPPLHKQFASLHVPFSSHRQMPSHSREFQAPSCGCACPTSAFKWGWEWCIMDELDGFTALRHSGHEQGKLQIMVSLFCQDFTFFFFFLFSLRNKIWKRTANIFICKSQLMHHRVKSCKSDSKALVYITMTNVSGSKWLSISKSWQYSLSPLCCLPFSDVRNQMCKYILSDWQQE